MKKQKMIKIYSEIIENICPESRGTKLANEVSRIAYDKHGLNAVAETQVHDALCEALDNYFQVEKSSKYRFDAAYGKLYEWDNESECYLFISSTQRKTEKEAIEEYEEYLLATNC